MKGRRGSAARALAMAAVLAVRSSNAGPGSATGAGAPRVTRSSERRPPSVALPARSGMKLWIAGGVGAVVPVPAGGGGGFTLAFELADRVSAGAFGHCAAASGGQTDGAAGNATASAPRKMALLCDFGLTTGVRGATRPVSPAIEIGIGWGFFGLVDETRSAGTYSGTGAVVFTQVGARIAERYQVMLRTDVPLFRASLDSRGTDCVHGVSLVGEFGFRIF
jgi:hypothetical protein